MYNIEPSLPTEIEFSIWDADKDKQATAWIGCWDKWPTREVFAHPAYLSLYRGDGVRCLCAAVRRGDAGILYPFLLRDLSGESFFPRILGQRCDICTPYGYGGPFTWGLGQNDSLATEFWERFGVWAEQNGVVSEFIRFHLFPESLSSVYPGTRESPFRNIVWDLGASEDALWAACEHKVRKNVKRATRDGVHVVADPEGERLEDFLRIYYGTMDRRDAGNGYYFPKNYFQAIQSRLKGQWMYFHALLEQKTISTELVLISKENIYSFLGGTDGHSFEHRPNDLLKFEIARWGKANQKLRYVLGGGAGQEDGIFKYKLSFCPTGAQPFYTGKRILNQTAFDALVEAKRAHVAVGGRDWAPLPGFFPAYRA